MEFDSTATLGALAKLPPEAPKIAEPKGSAWTAPFRAVPAAAAEVLAGGAELLTAGARLADRGGVAGMMQRGESLTSIKGETEVSRSLRNVAESYAPDPATAGTAERLVFGLTRGVGKAVGYGLTTGPAAPFLFGADEGLTQMDALQRQGVDTGTAMQAGGVAAAVNTAGFLIPVAGKTVAGTIGLGTLSGPASFIAQQAATREILARADYGKIAEQFDPLDPVGLGASLLPFGFGAWAMRGKIKGARPEPARPEPAQRIEPTMPADTAPARPVDAAPAAAGPVDAAPPAAAPVGDAASPVARPEVAQEHVDAAMVHNLTLAADHVEATQSGPLETLAQFAAHTLPKEAKAPREGPDPFLVWLKDNGGVSFADKFDITGEAGGVRLNRGGVFKKGGRGLDELAQIAEAEGWLPPGSTADIDGGVPALRDMLQRSMQGERIYPLAEQYQRMAQDHAAQQRTMEGEALAQRLQLLGVDPAPAQGNPDVLRAYLDQHEPRLLRQALADIADTTDAIPQPQPVKAAAPAETANTLQKLRSATVDASKAFDDIDARAAAGEQVDPDVYMQMAEEQSNAQDALSAGISAIPDNAFGLQAATRDGRMLVLNASAQQPGKWQLTRFDKSGIPFMDTQYDTKLSAAKEFVHESDPATIVSYDQQLDQPTNPKATPADVPQPAQPEPQASPQTQPQAAAQGTGPAATAAREAGAVAQALRSRADQVAAEAPDLVVGLTEDGQPITARQELERIRREAAEGTDDTLGGDDARFVDVAVQCALSQGD